MEINNAVEIVDTIIPINKLIFFTYTGKKLDDEAYIAKIRMKILDFTSLYAAYSRYFPTKYQFCREELMKSIYKLSYHIEASQHRTTEKLAGKLATDINTIRNNLAICEAFNLFKRKIVNKETEEVTYDDNIEIKTILNDKLIELEVLILGRVKSMRTILKKLEQENKGKKDTE